MITTKQPNQTKTKEGHREAFYRGPKPFLKFSAGVPHDDYPQSTAPQPAKAKRAQRHVTPIHLQSKTQADIFGHSAFSFWHEFHPKWTSHDHALL